MMMPINELPINRDLVRGSVVQSQAGHDSGQAFLVLRVENGFAWLADGRNRRHEQPKKKRVSHVRPLGCLEDAGCLDKIDKLGDCGQRNAALRQILQNFIGTNLTKEET